MKVVRACSWTCRAPPPPIQRRSTGTGFRSSGCCAIRGPPRCRRGACHGLSERDMWSVPDLTETVEVNGSPKEGRTSPWVVIPENPISTALMVSRFAMAEEWKGPTEQLDPYAYLIPKSYKPAMRTDGLIFADAKMMDQVRKDFAPEQVANVATMPGIVGRSMAMPDIHWGYGFPIGGVAAFDYDEGVFSPGGNGFDINCLSGESQVLSSHGYRQPISEFVDTWRKTRLASVNPGHRTKSTDIAAYMRFRAEVAYRVRTSTGVEITATAEHPFLTPDGMVPLKEVRGRPVAIYPFRGVDFREPPSDVLVSEHDILRPLTPSQVAQIKPVLRKRNLLGLTPRDERFPYILKIMGLALGDGHASLRPA